MVCISRRDKGDKDLFKQESKINRQYNLYSQILIENNQGRRELRKSGGAKSTILPHFLENSLFIAFLCDNFLGFSKSGHSDQNGNLTLQKLKNC